MINDLNAVKNKKALLVASTGGHLSQLDIIAQRLTVQPNSLWATFATPQSTSMLETRRHHYLRYVAPRDWRGVISSGASLYQVLRKEKFDVVISTGAAVAVSAMAAARMHNVEGVYIESVSRFAGPSLSGRIIRKFSEVSLFTQHPEWADSRWNPTASVLDDYEVERVRALGEAPSRVFVTLGTIRPYRFDALLNRLLAILPACVEVVWQTGCTDRMDLPGTVYREVSTAQFDALAEKADAVVSHAGVGSTLRLLELGVMPVLVPRRSSRSEHIDDHQDQIAAKLSRNGLVISAEVDHLSWTHIVEASHNAIRTPAQPT